MADCTEEDAVEAAQVFQGRVRQGLAGAEVAFAAEVQFGEVVGEAFRGGGGLKDLESFGGDFGSGSVAGNNSYAMHGAPWPIAAT